MLSRSGVIWSSIGGLTALVLIGGVVAVGAVANSQACNVSGYALYGDLVTSSAFTPTAEEASVVSYSESLIEGLRESDENERTKAILIEIDSYGGQPVAAEEIANALKRTEKPTVALIRTAGTSAAYWAATGADTIFASRNSDVGGIGVTLSLINEVEKNQKEGVGYITISSARYKDIGSPYRELTETEKQLLQRDVDVIHKDFVAAVSENRGLPLEAVEKLADGHSLLGSAAIEQGLIDEIGDQYDVEAYLEEVLGEEVRICWQTGEDY